MLKVNEAKLLDRIAVLKTNIDSNYQTALADAIMMATDPKRNWTGEMQSKFLNEILLKEARYDITALKTELANLSQFVDEVADEVADEEVPDEDELETTIIEA